MTKPSTRRSSSSPQNSLNVFAQRLNNSAALCIEVGQYDRAILSLQRALELSKNHMKDPEEEIKGERRPRNHQQFITLDGCISFSEANCLYTNATKSSSKSNTTTNTRTISDVVLSMVNATPATTRTTNGRIEAVSRGNKRRRIQIASSEPRASAFPVDSGVSSVRSGYYVFTRPIRVPRRGQQVGSVLFLAILFNLALAHHLKATSLMNVRRSNPSDSMTRANSVQKALMLYRLILDYWSKLRMREGQNSTDFSSIRFRMILHNNLGQIYNWTDNPIKEEECLQDLLSSVMFVTDQVHQHSGSSGAGTPCSGIGFKRDLEGFLTNTEALTAVERCAQAA